MPAIFPAKKRPLPILSPALSIPLTRTGPASGHALWDGYGATLVYDLTTNCLYNLYQNGRSTVNKTDILNWLDQAAAASHEEINGWSPQTKSKVASNYLTIARDFGLLEGVQQKSFARLYLP